MHVLWLTDLHLDDYSIGFVQSLVLEISAQQPDILLIAGDISNGLLLESHLKILEEALAIPIYFVLGNHDYYHRSIQGIQRQMSALSSPHLHYLSQESIVPLNTSTALIGHDGWADCRVGHFSSTPIMINDFYYIHDFKELTQKQRVLRMRQLADRSAFELKWKMEVAFAQYDQVIVLTHVPPFEEAALFKGYTNAYWSPYMVSQKVGEILKQSLANHPKKAMIVLCGHSHTAVDLHILPNLRVIVGKNFEKKPHFQYLSL